MGLGVHTSWHCAKQPNYYAITLVSTVHFLERLSYLIVYILSFFRNSDPFSRPSEKFLCEIMWNLCEILSKFLRVWELVRGFIVVLALCCLKGLDRRTYRAFALLRADSVLIPGPIWTLNLLGKISKCRTKSNSLSTFRCVPNPKRKNKRDIQRQISYLCSNKAIRDILVVYWRQYLTTYTKSMLTYYCKITSAMFEIQLQNPKEAYYLL